MCTHHWGFTSEPYHLRSQNVAGCSRNFGGVGGTFVGFVEPLGGIVDPVRRTLFGVR